MRSWVSSSQSLFLSLRGMQILPGLVLVVSEQEQYAWRKMWPSQWPREWPHIPWHSLLGRLGIQSLHLRLIKKRLQREEQGCWHHDPNHHAGSQVSCSLRICMPQRWLGSSSGREILFALPGCSTPLPLSLHCHGNGSASNEKWYSFFFYYWINYLDQIPYCFASHIASSMKVETFYT